MNELPSAVMTFGDLLKRLRKHAGKTQDDLAAAIGYSRSLVGALEGNHRLPDVEAIISLYVPALGLQEEPRLAAQLVGLAARARGERPPPDLAFKGARHPIRTTEEEDETPRLPAPPAEILGRREEIDHLCARLLGHHGRLLTLVGPPGVGKTRLAQAVAAGVQHFYRDGACFVTLAPVTDPALVASTLLSALRVHDGSTRPPEAGLVGHLRRKEMLWCWTISSSFYPPRHMQGFHLLWGWWWSYSPNALNSVFSSPAANACICAPSSAARSRH